MRYEIPKEKKWVYELVIPIRWGDMDALGHVNNTVYFRYTESIRIDWLQRIGGAPAAQGEGPVVVNAFCNFYRQLVYPGDVRVVMYVSDPGRTTFETWYTMAPVDEQDGVVYAEGGATTIWVDREQQKAIPLPDWLRAIVSDTTTA